MIIKNLNNLLFYIYIYIMENISLFDIVESFFQQINPTNNYEVYNSIYKEEENSIYKEEENSIYKEEEDSIYKEEENILFEVIKSFLSNLYGYNLYDDE
jgi:hypothetical protein